MFEFSAWSAFGFSGSRSAVPSVCAEVASCIPPGSRVFVGCAAGVDRFFRSQFPSAVVFSPEFAGRGGFAARSAACVSAVGAAGGLWVSFPAKACPVGLVPAPRWVGASGSGSWGSLALAVGSGVPSLVFSPVGLPAGWGFQSLGSGWGLFLPPAQLSLF